MQSEIDFPETTNLLTLSLGLCTTMQYTATLSQNFWAQWVTVTDTDACPLVHQITFALANVGGMSWTRTERAASVILTVQHVHGLRTVAIVTTLVVKINSFKRFEFFTL